MSMIDARCSKCGSFMNSYLTDSGDNLVVHPCDNGCTSNMPDKYTTQKDFEDQEEEWFNEAVCGLMDKGQENV